MNSRFTPVLASLFLGSLIAPTVVAQQVVVKNDQLPDDLTGVVGTLGFLGPFNFGEEQSVFLTAPCNGSIVAIDVLWGSMNGHTGTTVEQSLGLFEMGACDGLGTLNRSSIALQQPGFGDMVLIGPGLTANPNVATPNRFQFIDANNTVPMNVPVTMGQQFAITFEWGDDYCTNGCVDGCAVCSTYTGPFIPHDALGCTPCSNNVFGPPFGLDTCFFPSAGNIVMRVIIQCDSADGACCLPDGSCTEVGEQACIDLQGEFQGVASICSEAGCTPLEGACCVGGSCLAPTTLNDCETFFLGTWVGPGTTCTPDPCILPNGACCLPDKTCILTDKLDCESQSGLYNGDATICDPDAGVDCDPVGACCIQNAQTGEWGCLGEFTQNGCVGFGGSWKGGGTTCAVVDLCIPLGACCNASNDGCLDPLTEDDCTTFGFTWLGADTSCAGDGPPDSTCSAAFACEGDCSGPGGTPDGTVGIEDFLALLATWGTPGACDWDGVNLVGIGDFLIILANWGDCP